MEIIGNNQMITTAYIDRAHTFNNKKTAEKYCSLLPKAMKNLKYKVMIRFINGCYEPSSYPSAPNAVAPCREYANAESRPCHLTSPYSVGYR